MAAEDTKSERRRAERVKIDAAGQVAAKGSSGAATLSDISQTGAAVDADFDVNTDDEVAFSIGDGELLMGRVVRSTDNGFAFEFGAGPEGGEADDDSLEIFKKLTGLG